MNYPEAKETTTIPEIPLPPNWTILIHGSNLAKRGWESGSAQMDEEIFVVNATLGLSVITREEALASQQSAIYLRSQGIATTGFDTTGNYSRGAGISLEIRVAFPNFYSREPLVEGDRAKLVAKYGEDKVEAIVKLADLVYYRNIQNGRHPVLPKGMKLKKIADVSLDGQKRVVQYVPELLMDIYNQELGLN